MSANDNAMTRFLFAILQQKCLKDIDWNKVAHDPILTQEITNGHAARMRYSRFRAQMLGLEPQKRKRDPNKMRVTKKKKDDKTATKREDGGVAKSEDPVKKESAESPSVQDSSRPSTAAGAGPIKLSPKVKAEPNLRMAVSQCLPQASSPAASSVLSAAACAPPSMPDLHTQLHARLLTPCSDSDVMATSQGFATGGDIFAHSEPTLDFGSPSSHVHDAGMWHSVHSPTYGGFSVGGYGLENYSVAFCEPTHALEEHHHHHHHGHSHSEHHHADEHMGLSVGLMEQDSDHVTVKHEDWDSQHPHYHI